MRELQACDFCGADPVGVYEPLPDRLAADQPRVALCADCRDTLRRVLASLDADGGAEGDGATDGDAADNDATDADDATDAESPPAGRDGTSAPADPTDDAVTIDPAARERGDADDPSVETDADNPADADTTARPPGYANVLRLVRNREESLPRDELEAVASSAYDVTAAEAQRAVDAAIENGDLREADGAIRPA
jgi:hypothetical protein